MPSIALIHKNSSAGEDPKIDIAVRKSLEEQEPSLFKVLLHNDDFTPMDFVVEILQSIFHYEHNLAKKIMLDVHQKGVANCGIYPWDIAETKVSVVNHRSRKYEYPLRCTMERN